MFAENMMLQLFLFKFYSCQTITLCINNKKMEDEELRWRISISGQQIAAKLHEPGCNPNAKIDERYSIYKTYSGLICGWAEPDSIIALMSWRGLLDMEQIVAVYNFGTINLNPGQPNFCMKNWNLADLMGYLNYVDVNNVLARRYMEVPDQVR